MVLKEIRRGWQYDNLSYQGTGVREYLRSGEEKCRTLNSAEQYLPHLGEGQNLFLSSSMPLSTLSTCVHHASPFTLRLLQLLSYTSDVLIAGANYSAGPPDRTVDGQISSPPPAAKTSAATATDIPSSYYRHPSDSTASFVGSSSSTYLHVVDRLRTLRTWLLHPGGATAVAAYSLPAAVPRVPKNRIPSSKLRKVAQQPQQDSTHGGDNGADFPSPRHVLGPEVPLSQPTLSVLSSSGGGGDGRRQDREHATTPSESQSVMADGQKDDNEIEKEEVVDARRLPAGALVAAVLPNRFRGPNASAGPGILVAAGVTLSGVSFLPAEMDCGADHRSYLWTSTAEEAGVNDRGVEGTGGEVGSDEPMPPRVLGMRGITPISGAQQALALIWAERPSFQVLDVSRGGRAGIVEDVLLSRRHR